MIKNIQYLLALHCVDGLGPIRLKKVLEHFEDPKLAWEADLKEFRGIGMPQNVLENFKLKKQQLDPEDYFEKVQKSGIKVLTIFDEEYPKRLKDIYDPPQVLYYKGEILPQDSKAIAVVGTRKITGYGEIVTKKLTRGLSEAGFTIISGLATGVDTVAHKTALESGARTIAVLAGGINKIFPPQNTSLAQKISEGNGAYLSEYPLDYPHLSGNFPSRNRIISGLSVAVLVTEAAEDSGSLITARSALDQGREVFAVPGPITSSLSHGPASLIKDGAKLVTGVEDILKELGMDKNPISNAKYQMSNLSETETQILESLENEQRHIDELCRNLKKKSSEVSAALVRLEIMGIVKNLGSGTYIKTL